MLKHSFLDDTDLVSVTTFAMSFFSNPSAIQGMKRVVTDYACGRDRCCYGKVMVQGQDENTIVRFSYRDHACHDMMTPSEVRLDFDSWPVLCPMWYRATASSGPKTIGRQ